MSKMNPANGVPADRAVAADALFRGVPEDEDDEEEQGGDEIENEEEGEEDEGEGYSE
jgi:hypothetical protein